MEESYFPLSAQIANGVIIEMGNKSKFAHKLVNGEKVSSVEITPPRSIDLKSMLDKCEICKKVFQTVDLLKNHKADHAECKTC